MSKIKTITEYETRQFYEYDTDGEMTDAGEELENENTTRIDADDDRGIDEVAARLMVSRGAMQQDNKDTYSSEPSHSMYDSGESTQSIFNLNGFTDSELADVAQWFKIITR